MVTEQQHPTKNPHLEVRRRIIRDNDLDAPALLHASHPDRVLPEGGLPQAVLSRVLSTDLVPEAATPLFGTTRDLRDAGGDRRMGFCDG